MCLSSRNTRLLTILRPKRKNRCNEDAGEEEKSDDGDAEDDEDRVTDVDIQQLFPLPIYISDDLAPRRARLAKRARDCRNAKRKLQDTWIFDGKIMAKDNRGRITEIKRESDLPN